MKEERRREGTEKHEKIIIRREKNIKNLDNNTGPLTEFPFMLSAWEDRQPQTVKLNIDPLSIFHALY